MERAVRVAHGQAQLDRATRHPFEQQDSPGRRNAHNPCKNNGVDRKQGLLGKKCRLDRQDRVNLYPPAPV